MKFEVRKYSIVRMANVAALCFLLLAVTCESVVYLFCMFHPVRSFGSLPFALLGCLWVACLVWIVVALLILIYNQLARFRLLRVSIEIESSEAENREDDQ